MLDIHDKVVLLSETGDIMVRKFLVAFAILALVVASAGTVPAPGSNFRVSFTQTSIVKGSELKAGEYQVSLGADKATFKAGKTVVEAPVKVETSTEKYRTTSVRYTTENGKAVIAEIRIGGTTTRLMFN
jgi:hypothetical protein